MEREYFNPLWQKIQLERENAPVYPSEERIFRAFDLCDYDDVKVVLLGQDPYYNPEQATGLAFSTPNHLKEKPDTFHSIVGELGLSTNDSSLVGWTKQGVFLLNTVLTVRGGVPLSHRRYGWQEFTNQAIRFLNKREKPVIFMLWGGVAGKKQKLITNPQHTVLLAGHPSLLSLEYFKGCGHFQKANDILKSRGENPIDWNRTGDE